MCNVSILLWEVHRKYSFQILKNYRQPLSPCKHDICCTVWTRQCSIMLQPCIPCPHSFKNTSSPMHTNPDCPPNNANPWSNQTEQGWLNWSSFQASISISQQPSCEGVSMSMIQRWTTLVWQHRGASICVWQLANCKLVEVHFHHKSTTMHGLHHVHS